ncbi:hypothetical protein [Mycobacterium mantenii]|uniref:Uncharacterized protein n=1 Tax=Mycobacterium mantenii TaxID=560555 RepID=A0A1A2TRH8_MYCNT|nr:hypothetical protein [Mycobacterium mantenii]OBH43638.1 hypothetical protein A5688_12025 [Mycobacterium mantenii]OBH49043.1 hypothetical protein A5687_01425 [Mycobacterium mantenii]OBH78981.1 hypothetical protein A5683_16520 [Mycobacterium mantenii]OBH79523.1 hypothetical protein A5682_17785 [Mycobacterium mantenii]
MTPHVEFLAHHYLLLAAPAFLPAVIVVGVVLYIALRDRREGRGAAGSRTDASRSDTPDKQRD